MIKKLNQVKKSEDGTYHGTLVLYQYITIQFFIDDTHPYLKLNAKFQFGGPGPSHSRIREPKFNMA